MGAILSLDDGGQLSTSTMGASGALFLMSRQLPENRALARWLFDKSERPAPFVDFDTREFAETDRADFWKAVQRAHAELRSRQSPQPAYSPASDCIERLLAERARIDSGVPASSYRPPFEPFEQIDVHDTWKSANELDVEMTKAEAALSKAIAQESGSAASE